MAIDTVIPMRVRYARARKRRANVRHKLLTASCMMAVAVVGAAPAYADNLHGFGCGTGAGTPLDATSSPGNAATSPGSTHNEPGTVSINGGTGGAAYNNARQGAGAPSNY